jgi:glycosyltransferase involved in cell wall biosynthesis
MLKAFPGAPVYTSVYQPASTYPEFASVDVRPGALQRIPGLAGHHRAALPLMAPSFSLRRIEADTVLCCSAGWAHGARVVGRKVVYCYAPPRWIHQSARYLGSGRTASRAALALLRPWLAAWDQRAAASADHYLTLSRSVRHDIRQLYDIDAELLPPPHTLDASGPAREVVGLDSGYLLCVCRLLPYKNVGSVIDAFRLLPQQRLVIVGSGPQEADLRAAAPHNVTLLGTVDDEQLRWLYAHSSGVVTAAYEDYGLTPLEAASFGRPAVVLRAGGFLDTVEHGETGLFFDEPTPDLIATSVRELSSIHFDEARLRQHADNYSEGQFVDRLRSAVLAT